MPHTIARVGTALAAIAMTATACSNDNSRDAGGTSPAASTQAKGLTGKTACTSLRYVGDSISGGMVSAKQIPNPDERLEARFKAVGVRTASIDTSGGRAVFEPFEGRPTTLSVLPTSSKGFAGCYFMAIGTNDAGNVGAGADRSVRLRIDTVMKRLGDRPVLWPTIASELDGTPYASANMKKFNAELLAATKRYPNLRVYDWASERQPKWVEGDGIHDRRIGSRKRAAMYANALVVAFPEGEGMNPSKVVSSKRGKTPSPNNAPKLPPAKGDTGTFWAGDAPVLTHYVSGPSMK